MCTCVSFSSSSFESEYTVFDRLFTSRGRQSSWFVCLFFSFVRCNEPARQGERKTMSKRIFSHRIPLCLFVNATSDDVLPLTQRHALRSQQSSNSPLVIDSVILAWSIWNIEVKKPRRNVLDSLIFFSSSSWSRKSTGSLDDLEVDNDRTARWQSECRLLVEHPRMLTYPFIWSRPSGNV